MLKKTVFDGLKAIELRTKKLKLIAVYGAGPRIAFLGKHSGDNIFFWDYKHKYNRSKWFLRGGHRVWIARPGADESEETYKPDNSEGTLKLLDNGFSITSPVDTSNFISRGFSVRALSDIKLEIENFITNTGDMLYSASIWGLTCTLPSEKTKYAFSVGDGSGWDCFNLVLFNKWAGHGAGGFNDPQFSFSKDLMIVSPLGVENKRMLLSHKGISAMDDPIKDFTFIKKNTFESCGHYPMGSNQAVYIGPKNFMVEMETMSAESTIKPGETKCCKETWILSSSSLGLSKSKILENEF